MVVELEHVEVKPDAKTRMVYCCGENVREAASLNLPHKTDFEVGKVFDGRK